MISIALALQCILQYRLTNILSIKCYFRDNLKIDVTKNRIFRGISWVKLKSEIHSPGNAPKVVKNTTFLLFHKKLTYLLLLKPTVDNCLRNDISLVKIT